MYPPELPYFLILSVVLIVVTVFLLLFCLYLRKQNTRFLSLLSPKINPGQRCVYYDDLSESLSIALFEFDANSRELVYVSDNLGELTGISRSHLLKKDMWANYVLLDDVDALEQARSQCTTQSKPTQVEYRIYGKYQKVIWLRELVSLVKDEDGRSLLRGFITVIDKEKQAQYTALENEERFQQAIKGTAAAVWDLDLVTGKLYCSPHYQNMTGLDASEFPDDLARFVEKLIHPDDRDQVQAAVDTYLTGDSASPFECEHRLLQKDGGYRWIYVKGMISRDENKKPYRFTGFVTDITERKKAQEKLEFQASHDLLTGLVNRRQFESQAQRLLDQAKDKGVSHVLGFIDLDQFKLINDTSGHGAGDAYLKILGQNLTDKLPNKSIVARLGGDEFAFLLPDTSDKKALDEAEQIKTMIEEKAFFWEGNQFNVSASIGLVTVNKNSQSISELFKQADMACYWSKNQGRNRISFYKEDRESMQQHAQDVHWLARVKDALENKRFELYTQLIAPLAESNSRHHNTVHYSTGHHDLGYQNSRCYEILLRMKDTDGNIFEPNRFFPIAERYGLGSKIDYHVIESVLLSMIANPSFVSGCGFISITLSAQTLTEKKLAEFILQKADNNPQLLSRLCFEISEAAVIQNFKRVSAFISELKQHGVRFALDDFGKGLSSFSYLKELSVDYLRVDGMFVREMENTDADFVMVKSINEIGHTMGLQTIAEYVESEGVVEKLRSIGVDYCQGHHIHAPVALQDVISNVDQTPAVLYKRP